MGKRKKKRVFLNREVVINGAVYAQALDISEDGMYLYTTADFAPQAVLDLGFSIGDEQIKAKAAILHREPGIGIGVQFRNISPDNRMAIKRFLAGASSTDTEHRAPVVLLVDETPQSRAIYKNRLVNDGFMVIEASDGLEVVRNLKKKRPDVVILDVKLTKFSGFKILHIMNADPELRCIPVIVLSSHVTPEDVQKAVALGAKEYLAKATTTPIRLTQALMKALKDAQGGGR
jgi:CheY-like chemotaxis protein